MWPEPPGNWHRLYRLISSVTKPQINITNVLNSLIHFDNQWYRLSAFCYEHVYKLMRFRGWLLIWREYLFTPVCISWTVYAFCMRVAFFLKYLILPYIINKIVSVARKMWVKRNACLHMRTSSIIFRCFLLLTILEIANRIVRKIIARRF